MPLLDIIILALIQGITEFLPISSSGHLVLAHAAMDGNTKQDWNNHILLDVAVHVGTLFSVLLYFRKDVTVMISGVLKAASGQTDNDGAKLACFVIISSIPVILAGLALHMIEPSWLLAVEIVAWTTLIFGILLWIADRREPSDKALENLSLKDAILFGLAQTLALIPGTSRSGITMTAGRFMGYSRTESAHFSLLLGIIAISGAGAIGGLTMLEQDNIAVTHDVFLAAFLAFISGWIAIALMMKWLERSSFTPFAIYRIILGIALLGFLYWPA